MLKCYNQDDNNCTKECNGRIKTCPMSQFLNGERKTKPNRKAMAKFIETYRPPKKKPFTPQPINKVGASVANAVRTATKTTKMMTTDECVDALMKIVYGPKEVPKDDTTTT